MLLVWRSDLKTYLAGLLSIGGMLAIALLVQQCFPNHTFLLPLFLLAFSATALMGFWGLGACSIILATIAFSQGSGFLAASFLSYLLFCMTFFLLSREKNEASPAFNAEPVEKNESEVKLHQVLCQAVPYKVHVEAIVEPVELPKQETVPQEAVTESAISDNPSLWEYRYRELQKQFKEKSQVLHETRKELFAMESRFLSQEIEIQELSLQDNAQSALWQKEVDMLLEEKETLLKENEHLHEIISSSFTKKESLPKNLPYGQVDLFSLRS